MRLLPWLLVLMVFGSLAMPEEVRAEDAAAKISETLKAATTVEFVDTPLADAVNYLKDLHGIRIVLDQPALEASGIPADLPVTLDADGFSLRAILETMLTPRGVTWVIQDEVLLLTTTRAVEQMRSVKTYAVNDLVAAGISEDELISVIRALIAPASWADPGVHRNTILPLRYPAPLPVVSPELAPKPAGGTIRALAKTVVVWHHPLVQRQIAEFLEEVKTVGVRHKPRAMSARETQIWKVLESDVAVDFIETPLKDATDYLADRYEIPIFLDEVQLGIADLATDSPLTATYQNMTLASLLDHLFRGTNFGWTVRNDMLVVTSRAALQQRRNWLTRCYDVREFVTPGISEPQLISLLAALLSEGSWTALHADNGQLFGETVPTLRAKELRWFQKTLVVSQPAVIHRQIKTLLSRLRRYQSNPRWPLSPAEKREAKIAQVLTQSTQLELIDTPLSDTLDYLSDLHSIRILIDPRAKQAIPNLSTAPISMALSGVKLSSALNLLLRPLKLDWYIQDEAVLITTTDIAAKTNLVKFYPLAGYETDDLKAGNLWYTIHTTIAPEEWLREHQSHPRGAGYLIGKSLLVVSQPRRIHTQIQSFLEQLPDTEP